ncbi:Mu transposase C-terminal domain-containing protein [Alicyclobacillus fastidiosus]
MATLTIGFLPKTMKTYRSEGIRHNHVLYRHEGRIHMEHIRGTKCEVRYDPDDISKIYVLQPTHEYIEIPAVMPPAELIETMITRSWKALRYHGQNQTRMRPRSGQEDTTELRERILARMFSAD